MGQSYFNLISLNDLKCMPCQWLTCLALIKSYNFTYKLTLNIGAFNQDPR
jgi:hypothetical protein